MDLIIVDRAEPLDRISDLLGGAGSLGKRTDDPFAAHDALERGLPGKALHHLFDSLRIIEPSIVLDKAIGVSLRTLQRSRLEPKKALSPEQSSRAWTFAHILTDATDILGSQEAAERWLEQPATALGQRAPLALLSTAAGVSLVEDLLGQMRYGVYT